MSNSLKLSWDDSLSTGVPAVDVQHRYLIDVINELADAIEYNKGRKAIGKILNMLKYYTVWHFGREEKCMDRYQCPAAEINKKAHAKFIETFERFHEEFLTTTSAEDLALRMYQELTEWLVKHIKGVDGQLNACVHRKQTKAN